MNHSTTRKQIQKRLQENSGAESLLEASMSWMEPLYDPEQGLLRYPQNPEQHMVRESLWFAFGLVLQVRFFGRNESDLIQAENIVQQVLANQYAGIRGTVYTILTSVIPEIGKLSPEPKHNLAIRFSIPCSTEWAN